MNLYKNKIFLFLVPVMLAASCKKNLDSAYLNPNAPTVVPIETLLPGVIGSMVGASSGTGVSGGVAGDALVIGRYIQYWGDNTGQASANFLYDEMGGPVFTSGTLATIWNGFYFGQGQNVNQIIAWGSQQQKWDYVGVAWAIRAWGWLELADEYADGIIVKEAFNTNLQQFAYDPESLAYDTCRATCFRALAYLNTTGGATSQTNLALGDAYMNKGDVNLWKKFVYGVLARSYGYLSNKNVYKSSGYADSTIKYCNLAQTANADNTTAKFAGNVNVSGMNSYYGPTRGNVGSLRQAAYITNLMTGANSAFPGVFDPRAWYMLRQNLSSKFAGITPWLGNGTGGGFTTSANDPNFPPNFWGNTTVPQSASAPAGASVGTLDSGRYLFRNIAEFPMMTASEMQFLLAEAAYRKGDKATALAAYSNAISLNFDMLSNNYNFNIPASQAITPANKAAYLAAVVPSTSDSLTLTKIMLQKYIALYGWGPHETWVDMRRFHYTDVDPVTGVQVYADFAPPSGAFLYVNNNGKLVYRAKPQNVEYTYDVPSLTAIGALNLDYHTKECWFSMP